jgi:hypothetical protein
MALLLAGLPFPACTLYGTGSESPTWESVNRKVWLTEDNFRVVESHAEGYARCPNLLMLPYPVVEGLQLPQASGVPLGNPHVVEQAMADLLSGVEMEGRPRILHNVIVEYYTVSYLLYGYVEARVSGEVIEFTDEALPASFGGRRDP